MSFVTYNGNGNSILTYSKSGMSSKKPFCLLHLGDNRTTELNDSEEILWIDALNYWKVAEIRTTDDVQKCSVYINDPNMCKQCPIYSDQSSRGDVKKSKTLRKLFEW